MQSPMGGVTVVAMEHAAIGWIVNNYNAFAVKFLHGFRIWHGSSPLPKIGFPKHPPVGVRHGQVIRDAREVVAPNHRPRAILRRPCLDVLTDKRIYHSTSWIGDDDLQ